VGGFKLKISIFAEGIQKHFKAIREFERMARTVFFVGIVKIRTLRRRVAARNKTLRLCDMLSVFV
jgi:hypothetical protein